MSTVTREQFLKGRPLKTKAVEIPDLGTVYVKELTGAERDRIDAAVIGGNSVVGRALIVSLSACDDQGRRLFTEADTAALGQLPHGWLDQIVEASSELNGFAPQDIERLEGNSDDGPSGASGSSSPAPSGIRALPNASAG